MFFVFNCYLCVVYDGTVVSSFCLNVRNQQ